MGTCTDRAGPGHGVARALNDQLAALHGGMPSRAEPHPVSVKGGGSACFALVDGRVRFHLLRENSGGPEARLLPCCPFLPNQGLCEPSSLARENAKAVELLVP